MILHQDECGGCGNAGEKTAGTPGKRTRCERRDRNKLDDTPAITHNVATLRHGELREQSVYVKRGSRQPIHLRCQPGSCDLVQR